MLLALKLILVPLLIAAVTLASRRRGPRAAGLLMALPIVAGPTLCFYAIEQGDAFAAEAARATLLGLVAVGGFCLTYAHTATVFPWPASLVLAYLTFGMMTVLLYGQRFGLVPELALAVVALLTARRFLPARRSAPPATAPPPWDLPLRVLAAAGLVFVLTSAAERLGPSLSGVLTPFPVATAIIAGFSHAQRGAEAVSTFFREFIPGLCSFAIFCFVLAVGLPAMGLAAAVAVALTVQLAVQAAILWFLTPRLRLP